MTPQAGCRFAVAPHFHLPVEWPRRLLLGTGVGEAGGRFFPRGPWRAPPDDGLSTLVAEGAPEDPGDCVCLFGLPDHLRSGWWELLERAGGLPDGGLPGFDAFVDRLAEFLAFKDLPVPEGACCEVVLSQPGQESVRRAPGSDSPAGLMCSVAPWAPWPPVDESRWPRLWGGINLGAEETSVVLINLPGPQLAAELRRRRPDRPAPATVGELAREFLRSCADYPPVRLALGPGEGFRLPRGGLILDGYPQDKQEPDVLLLISAGGQPPA